MKKITLFVGDCDTTIAKISQQFDNRAVLIDCTNYKKILENNNSEFTGYTSLAEFPNDRLTFYNVLTAADSIRYCPPTQWSDNKIFDIEYPELSMQGTTEWFLYTINKVKNNVIGLDLPNVIDCYSELENQRQSADQQLWAVGCSTTAGVGVEPSECYGNILNKSLNLPISFLARRSTSISWAADQILRSDIRANDIVIWGLTSENRVTLWDDLENKPVHVASTSNTKIFSTDVINRLLAHKTNFFVAVQKILEVVNFCNKLKIKLLIINIHSSNSLNLHLHTIKEFFPYIYPADKFIDTGTDNQHPGPLQHQAYADFCHSALKQLQYI
jgi:hypothetical protein